MDLQDIVNVDDTTMPTWGVSSAVEDPFQYGALSDVDMSPTEDDFLSNEMHQFYAGAISGINTRSHTPTSESEPSEYTYSPTEYDYTSGSEADIDTDDDPALLLDNLEPISPHTTASDLPSTGILEDDPQPEAQQVRKQL